MYQYKYIYIDIPIYINLYISCCCLLSDAGAALYSYVVQRKDYMIYIYIHSLSEFGGAWSCVLIVGTSPTKDCLSLQVWHTYIWSFFQITWFLFRVKFVLSCVLLFSFFSRNQPVHVRDFKHNHVLYRPFSIIHVFTCPNLLALPLITKGLTLAQGTKSLAFKLPCSTRLASLKKMFWSLRIKFKRKPGHVCVWLLRPKRCASPCLTLRTPSKNRDITSNLCQDTVLATVS